MFWILGLFLSSDEGVGDTYSVEWRKCRNPMFPSVMYYRQNPLELIKIVLEETGCNDVNCTEVKITNF
jgi:hypothetical protein